MTANVTIVRFIGLQEIGHNKVILRCIHLWILTSEALQGIRLVNFKIDK